MPSFLLITLAAPLASFGELAGHERRGGRERPGKSALTGLLGAALGVRREDHESQQALAETIETGVRVDNPGHALQDFHTTQTISSKNNFHPQTRAEALAHGERNTILTRRDYRADVLYTAAYQPLAACPWTLEQMAGAMRKPFFTLCLGRKSCPLSLPLNPRIIEAENMLAALEHHAALHDDSKQTVLRNAVSKGRTAPYIAISATAISEQDNRAPRLERTSDQPLDRLRWHFAERREAIYPLATKPEGTR
jgi:CRISPR system Cascade subunit CasD